MTKAIAFRLISAVLMLYFSIARFGETQSYFEAFGTAFLFYAVWWLGLRSNHLVTTTEK